MGYKATNENLKELATVRNKILRFITFSSKRTNLNTL